MEKEKSQRLIRSVGGIIGILAIFLPWESVGWGSFNLGLSLVAIMSLTPDAMILIGAIAFVLGALILFLHSGGVIGEIIGLVIVGGTILSVMADSEYASLGIGFYLGLVSCAIAGVGALYGWAWSEQTPKPQ